MKTKYLLFFLLSILIIHRTSGVAQLPTKTVNGIVTSFKTVPLKNVKVASVKAGETAYTDSMGRFLVNTLRKDILTISASGFVTRKIKVGKENTYKIDIVYLDNISNFNDATNNGHITSDALRKAILSKESANTKDYSKYKSIYELIASEIYNVRVNGTTIVNTKVKSFDRTPEVLLVVDGKVVTDISYISPDYVRSIEFIDDIGTTMYGSMGANGVLKITLK